MLIGEVASATGTTTKTLRFYERAGLLPDAARTANGYRDYGPETRERVDFIHRGQAAGLTLAQIREILTIRDGGRPPCAHVCDLLTAQLGQIDHQIARLRDLKATVTALRDNAAHADPGSCQPDDICRYL
jgi:DNA-binding transcriptional MerR regulator